MKMVVVSCMPVADKGKTAAMQRGTTVTAGAESIWFLPMVPELEVLTLQMEREVRKNLLSWQWKATAQTAKKKPDSDTKAILLIRE